MHDANLAHRREDKNSCKGIQKKRNEDNLTKEAYLNVLMPQKAGMSANKGSRSVDGKIYTYNRERRGLSYTYPKPSAPSGRRRVTAN